MSIVQDPIRPLDPSSLQELIQPDREAETGEESPEPIGNGPSRTSSMPERMSTTAEDGPASLGPHMPLGKTSFELESRGGYVRTVSGTVAYLDEEAQTYMVHGSGGELLRVPLRDITSSHETAANETDRLHPDDAEGLGTSQ